MVTALLLMIPIVLALFVQASFLLRRPAGQATAIAQVDVSDPEVIADPA